MNVPLEAFLLAGLILTISVAAGLSTEIAKSVFKRLDSEKWAGRLPIIAAIFGALWGAAGSPLLTHVLEQIFKRVADGELAPYQNQMRMWWAFIGMGAGWASAGVYRQIKSFARPGLLRLLNWWKPEGGKK